jgi:hypothetical protein
MVRPSGWARAAAGDWRQAEAEAEAWAVPRGFDRSPSNPNLDSILPIGRQARIEKRVAQAGPRFWVSWARVSTPAPRFGSGRTILGTRGGRRTAGGGRRAADGGPDPEVCFGRISPVVASLRVKSSLKVIVMCNRQ